ncbi:MAG TPA: hydrogenase maturation protease [Terriglobales bacterium]|nr:hydrogenase maturation protease [Terriglobales bacterium]
MKSHADPYEDCPTSVVAGQGPRLKTLVLGYGNPLRSDDGLGWHAAEQLAATLPDLDAEIRTTAQLTPELALPISEAGLVIFIDATREGEPGELTCNPLTPQLVPVRSSHHLSPEAVLALSKYMYGVSPPAFLVSLCGACFGLGEELSPAVAGQLPRLVSLVAQLAESGSASAASLS